MSSLSAAGSERSDEGAVPNPKRPVGVLVLAVVGMLQGILLIVVGTALGAAHADPEVLEAADTSASVLLAVAVVIGVAGVIGVALGIALARGSRVGQTLYGALATFQVATTSYTVVSIPEGRVAALLPLGVGLLVIWLLYGSPRTQEYFRQ